MYKMDINEDVLVICCYIGQFKPEEDKRSCDN